MTWFQYYNYGTILQATALYNLLQQEGNNVDVINYISKVNDRRSIYRIVKDSLYRLIYYKKCNIVKSTSKDEFDTFVREHMTFSDRCQSSIELNHLNANYDIFVCGSDQIWSPKNFDSHYFLDFVQDPNMMIAYAPSFGELDFRNDTVKNYILNLTRRFKHLSVRENSSVEMLKKYNINADFVLDPTLLISKEKWSNILNLNNHNNCEPYILFYFLKYNEEHYKQAVKIANRLKLKIKIIPTLGGDLKRSGCIKRGVGPIEFVELIKNASYVCTDSYHGMIFSIIYQKNFTIFERFDTNNKYNQNARIYSLLKALGLNNRLSVNNIDKIAYDDVNEKLDININSSLKFLHESLHSAEEYNKIKG